MARIVTVTVSDAHQGETDTSGPALAEALRNAGHDVVRHERTSNDRESIQHVIEEAASSCDVVFLTGGTGLGPKDVTVEVVESLLEKTLDGFGEQFRRQSFDQIGARAMMSRATAGVFRGCLIFAVPGSTKGAVLGAEIASPILNHASDVVKGTAKKH